MEGQLLYCTYLSGGNGGWKHTSIPISQEYIDSTNSEESISVSWDIVRSLVEELSKLCGKNGAMEGWKLHRPGDLEIIYGKRDSFGTLNGQKYGAKVVLTRQITPSVPEARRQAPKPTTRDF